MQVEIFTHGTIKKINDDVQCFLKNKKIRIIKSIFNSEIKAITKSIDKDPRDGQITEITKNDLMYMYILEYENIDEKKDFDDLTRKISVEVYQQLKDIKEGLLCIDDLKTTKN